METLFAEEAIITNVPEKLLWSICHTESRLSVLAYNHHDGGHNNSAFGVCQVLLKTAEGLGFKDRRGKCRTGHAKCRLFDPQTNIRYAAKYLKKQLVRYKNNIKLAVSAYNAGTAKKCKKRLCNQKYVDKVLEIYNNRENT